MEKIQVLVVSNQSFFRQGIAHSLTGIPDIEIQGTVAISDEVLSAIDNLPPDVALIDIDGAADEGLSLAKNMRQRSSSIAVVVLSSNPNDSHLFLALKAQAVAYIGKNVDADQLVSLIKRVAMGEHPINDSVTTRPQVAEQVLKQFQKLSWKGEAEALVSPTTPRETEILRYIAQGYLNKQIAAELGISEQTIKNHVTSILRKLNANARTEAVVVAIKQGLISLD